MADFKTALQLVLKYEGGYVDHPDDKGGATNKGITLNTYRKYNPQANKENLKSITDGEVEKIYAEGYWYPYKYSQINSQILANKLFATGVNLSNKMANKFMQESVNMINLTGEKLFEDGIIGDRTIELINSLTARNLDNTVLKIYVLLQKEYYSNLVIKDNSQLVFLRGWFNRAEDNLSL